MRRTRERNLAGGQDKRAISAEITCMQRTIRWTAIAIALLAPISLVVTTLPSVVNVPFMDEWAWAPLAYHARTGTLTADLLFAPHNEHRNVLPNLVFLAIDHIIGWDVRAESAFSLAVFIGADGLLWQLVRRTIPGLRGLVAFALVSLVLCSFGQWENFVLGYNIGWNLCTLGIIAMVLLLTSPQRGIRACVAAALVAAGASFSSGQGFVLWPCGLGLIALAGRKAVAAIAIWLVCAGVVSAGYFFDYHPDALVIPADARPTSATSFFFAFLGGVLRPGSGSSQAVLCGAVVLLALIVAVAFAYRSSARRDAYAPWLALAAYGLLGAALTAIGRHVLGDDYAIDSHYEAIAVFIPLATIGIVAVSWFEVPARVRSAWATAAALLILLTFGVDTHGLRYIHQYAAARRAEVAALPSGGPDLVTLAFPDRAELREFLGELRAVHDTPFLP
jgi:hypothetical protein